MNIEEINRQVQNITSKVIKGEIQDIIKEFYDLIFQLIESENENVKIVYYRLAEFLLQYQFFDKSIEFFIKSYEMQYRQEEIISLLYKIFILPQRDNFKKNYEENKQGYTNISYDELPIEFISISENIYYIFHKEKKVFYERIDMNSFKVDEILNNKNFRPLLITNQQDFFKILPLIQANRKQVSYIVADEENELISYLKLPNFSKMFLENTIIFKNEQIMKLYFQEYSDTYLPRLIIAGKDKENYQQYFKELHEKRIKDNRIEKRNAIILSFCIPSYNRGHRAIQLVENLLESEFDAEIEIVISNNGSKENKQGYEFIKNIKDTRLKYHEFEENQGVVENCCKVLELAQGRFAVLVTDEETVRLDNIGYYLYEISSNPEIAIIHTNTGGGENIKERKVYPEKKKIFSLRIQSYMGGHIYNKFYLQQYDVLNKMRMKKENALVYTYPHSFLELYLVLSGRIVEDNCFLITIGKQEETSVFVKKTKYSVPSFSLGNARIKQAQGMLEVLLELSQSFSLSIEERMNLYGMACENYYMLLKLSTKNQIENGDNMLYFADELLEMFYNFIFKWFFNYEYEELINWAIEKLKNEDSNYRIFYLREKNNI